MSNILFDPKNISSTVPRDVLNIIGTYSKHPLAEMIKKEMKYIILPTLNAQYYTSYAHITVGEKQFRYNSQNFIRRSNLYYEETFTLYLWDVEDHYITKCDNSNFEIYKGFDDEYFLRSKIPMHIDTFMTFYNYLQKK